MEAVLGAVEVALIKWKKRERKKEKKVAETGNRSRDLPHRYPLLYQLSYRLTHMERGKMNKI